MKTYGVISNQVINDNDVHGIFLHICMQFSINYDVDMSKRPKIFAKYEYGPRFRLLGFIEATNAIYFFV